MTQASEISAVSMSDELLPTDHYGIPYFSVDHRVTR